MWLVLRKDLAIERRSGEITTTSAFFALLVVVISSMAFLGTRESGRALAGGVVWLSVAFALVLSLGRGWAREREGGAFEGLLTTPLEPSALFAGKTLGLMVFLVAIQLVVIPAAALFFHLDLLRVGPGLAVISVFTTPGIAAAGTLFGVMTVRTRARDLALSMVLFPLLSPALLVAVAASRTLLEGATLLELGGFFRLLAVFAFTFWMGGLALFGTLVED